MLTVVKGKEWKWKDCIPSASDKVGHAFQSGSFVIGMLLLYGCALTHRTADMCQKTNHQESQTQPQHDIMFAGSVFCAVCSLRSEHIGYSQEIDSSIG